MTAALREARFDVDNCGAGGASSIGALSPAAISTLFRSESGRRVRRS